MFPSNALPIKVENAKKYDSCGKKFRNLPITSSEIEWIPNNPLIQWTSNGIVICDAPNDQSYSVMCSDGQGGRNHRLVG